jgi:hypothetical protein
VPHVAGEKMNTIAYIGTSEIFIVLVWLLYPCFLIVFALLVAKKIFGKKDKPD